MGRSLTGRSWVCLGRWTSMRTSGTQTRVSFTVAGRQRRGANSAVRALTLGSGRVLVIGGRGGRGEALRRPFRFPTLTGKGPS